MEHNSPAKQGNEVLQFAMTTVCLVYNGLFHEILKVLEQCSKYVYEGGSAG